MNLISNAIKFTPRGGKICVGVAKKRVTFVSEKLSERYFRKAKCLGEFPQQDQVPIKKHTARYSAAEATVSSKAKETGEIEQVMWNQGTEHKNGTSKKLKQCFKKEDELTGEGPIAPTTTYQDEYQLMPDWPGENKYFVEKEKDDGDGEKGDYYEYLHFAVKDSGRGVPERLKATLFDPFVQVN